MAILSYDDPSSPDAKAALDAVAQVMAQDVVTLYIARPGQEHTFVATLLEAATQAGVEAGEPYTIFEIQRLRCMALMHDVGPQPWPEPPGGPSFEALQAAMQEGGGDALRTLGLPPGRVKLLAAVRPERLHVLHQLESEVDEIRRGFTKEHGPLLHLHFLATSVDARGNGHGARLLQHLGRLADAQGKAMYLEASTEHSRRLYERAGFRDVRKFYLGGEGSGGPVFHMMIRPVGSSASAATQSAG